MRRLTKSTSIIKLTASEPNKTLLSVLLIPSIDGVHHQPTFISQLKASAFDKPVLSIALANKTPN